MEPEPVSSYPRPQYPTRREFLAASAAALAAAGISGCGKAQGASALVAPIFAHGEGQGATGCVVMSPPVFLSEEEALEVVKEELAKVGITLGEGMPLDEVTIEYEDPESRRMRSGDNWLGEPSAKVARPADLAAVDRQQRVGVEIVTTKDYERFGSGNFGTVSLYDTKALAEATAEGIRAQAKENLSVGVFYDPLEKWSFADPDDTETSGNPSENLEKRVERTLRSSKERSRAKLRRQAQDFVAWLKKNQ